MSNGKLLALVFCVTQQDHIVELYKNKHKLNAKCTQLAILL